MRGESGKAGVWFALGMQIQWMAAMSDWTAAFSGPSRYHDTCLDNGHQIEMGIIVTRLSGRREIFERTSLSK